MANGNQPNQSNYGTGIAPSPNFLRNKTPMAKSQLAKPFGMKSQSFPKLKKPRLKVLTKPIRGI